MWNEDYEALNSFEKGEFRRIANHLLSCTYLTKYNYLPSKQMTMPNRDYQLASRFFNLLDEYFSITGWRLDRDDIYGFISLSNSYENNRFRMDQFTTLFLYTCRLIYEEKREQASSFHTVLSNTHDIVLKMATLGILKNGKSTQKERLEAQRTLAHFNLIEKMETSAWEPDGNRILILPSILAVVSNQGINDMKHELDDLRQAYAGNGGSNGEDAASGDDDDDNVDIGYNVENADANGDDGDDDAETSGDNI